MSGVICAAILVRTTSEYFAGWATLFSTVLIVGPFAVVVFPARSSLPRCPWTHPCHMPGTPRSQGIGDKTPAPEHEMLPIQGRRCPGSRVATGSTEVPLGGRSPGSSPDDVDSRRLQALAPEDCPSRRASMQ